MGVVNWEDDPLISMVEVDKQLPAKWWIATNTKIHLFSEIELAIKVHVPPAIGL